VRVGKLTGRLSDASSPAYRYVIARLDAVRRASPTVRFTYLVRESKARLCSWRTPSPRPPDVISPPGRCAKKPPDASSGARGPGAVMGPEADRWGRGSAASLPSSTLRRAAGSRSSAWTSLPIAGRPASTSTDCTGCLHLLPLHHGTALPDRGRSGQGGRRSDHGVRGAVPRHVRGRSRSDLPDPGTDGHLLDANPFARMAQVPRERLCALSLADVFEGEHATVRQQIDDAIKDMWTSGSSRGSREATGASSTLRSRGQGRAQSRAVPAGLRAGHDSVEGRQRALKTRGSRRRRRARSPRTRTGPRATSSRR